MMVAPSLEMMTLPLASEIILSMPFGPRLVRTASATAASRKGNREPHSEEGPVVRGCGLTRAWKGEGVPR